MDDLISRQSIKRKLQEHHDFLVETNEGWIAPSVITNARIDEISNCIAKIANEPSVQPEHKWIPVSERLPNFNDIVLASADSNYDELRVIITVYSAEEFWFNGKIKAWMPLPEPYKAESEDKE